MKVGTDAMVLGASIGSGIKGNCLEIGTGTGVISLMLLQRSPELKIKAIDIDALSIEEAIQNFSNSPWNDRVEGIHIDFLHYITSLKFDLIVTNPPYFEDGLLNDSKRKANTRHEVSLPLSKLVEKSSHLLSEVGVFVMILPAHRAQKWKNNAKDIGLFCLREITIFGKPNISKRTILFFSKSCNELIHEELIIRNEDNSYTEMYKQLTIDFHGVQL